MTTSTTTRAGLLAITAATAFLAAGCGSDDDSSAPQTSPSGSPSGSSTGSSTQSSSPTADPTAFTAGTYEVQAQYNNPDGVTSIKVSLSLDDDGTVTDVTVTPEATGGNGLMFQKIFAENIGAEVVGKPITEIEVDKVAGSSLTSAGFNSAVDAVIAQAAQ